jgi:branched-chain amino acid transport system ATP-binding protein
VLLVEHLRAGYGRIEAIRDVSLEVRAGELVSIIGPNGAGKSTLLLTLAGAIRPWRGRTLLEGEQIAGATPEAIAKKGVSLVPEGRRVFARLSVEENLRLGATVKRAAADASETLESIYERFPALKELRHRSAGKLSGGEQQALAIGRALMSKPRLLLLDEPSLGLAPMMIELVFGVLDELRKEGVTILLVEQNAAAAVELADRSYVMREGTIAAAGTSQELLSDAAVAELYLGSGLR